MKSVCLVNGSLRGRSASSLIFLNDLAARLVAPEFSSSLIGMTPGRSLPRPTRAFGAMACADAVVLAFPLFAYCLSGGFVRFLEDYLEYLDSEGGTRSGTRLYAIVNCGYPDPRITVEALRVVRNFCARAGLEYRFSVAIGCGPAAVMTRKVPLLNRKINRAWRSIASDIESPGGGREDIFVRPGIPKAILLRIKDAYEDKAWPS